MRRLIRAGLLLASISLASPGHIGAAASNVLAAAPTDASLQGIVERSAQAALAPFTAKQLRANQLAISLVDLRVPARPRRASVRGDVPIYPASVVKLFYLAAAHRWLEDGQLADTPELRRALGDMIISSSNDATHYVVDLLTGTTSGPELPDEMLADWFERRNAVNRYFGGLGYTHINANKKPWAEGPYGRETQATKRFEPRRNMLTTDATARLLAEIATGQCVTPARSSTMMQLLARDITKPMEDPEDQAGFTGPALPRGAKLWSKAGWTSQTRHDAAYIELPGGAKFVLVVFTIDHAKDHEIIRTVARSIIRDLTGMPGVSDK